MPQLKLSYFDFHGGRAEPIRLALAIGGIAFEDHRFTFPEFAEVRKTVPFGQVPVMHVDGVQVTQSDAMLRYAAGYQDGPIAIRYPRGIAVCSGKPLKEFSPGKAKTIHKGKKIALLAAGDTLGLASEIWQKLKDKGHQPWLVNLISLKPLDEELLLEVGGGCQHVFTFESNSVIGGIGSRIAQILAEQACKVVNFGYPDHFVTHGKISELHDLIGFTADKLLADIEARLDG